MILRTLINHRRYGFFRLYISLRFALHARVIDFQIIFPIAMIYTSHIQNESRWLLNKACRIMMDDRWPTEIPLSFDGSGFEGEERDEAVLMFFDTLCKWGKVRELTVKNIFLNLKSKERFESVLESNPLLEKLALVNVSTHEGGMHFLSRSLFSANKQIREFTMEKCQLWRKDTLFIQRLLGVGMLKVLSLRNIDLDEIIPRISSRIAHCVTIRKLDFNGSRICQEVLVELLQGISMNNSLISLSLQNCGIGSSLAKDLDHMLANHSSLETLDLSSNNIRGETISLLAKSGLEKNISLKKLLLSQNPIGDKGAESLVELLVSNPTIQYLSLVDCEIWGSGCLCLATGLARMTGLKDLLVDGEMEDYANEVLQSLASNMTLRYLWTDRSAYLFHKDRTWRLVEFYLRLNRAKRRMLVEPGVPISLWPLVLEGISGNPHLTYHILRQKPEIMATIM